MCPDSAGTHRALSSLCAVAFISLELPASWCGYPRMDVGEVGAHFARLFSQMAAFAGAFGALGICGVGRTVGPSQSGRNEGGAN